jgi:tripartite-type tricarboxylate transporter receptor subunit TctC
MKLISGLFAAFLPWLAASNALAQGSFPEKGIRILVGFPSGGPPDIAARLLADKFSQSWDKPVVVENVTGAGGNIAIDRAITAAPDGYTLVMASSAITINPSLYEKTPYDPVKDLAPISVAVFTPSILVVNNEVPAKESPAGIAQPVIDKLHLETVRALSTNDVRKRLGDAGMEVVGNTPAEFAAVIKSELQRWAKLVKDAGIKPSE